MPSIQVKQFFSDLRVQDFYGTELLKKTISVNDPLRCQVCVSDGASDRAIRGTLLSTHASLYHYYYCE